MPDPVSFTSTSPRFGLPLLFAAQTQKEFFVNQAHALTDLLLHPAVEGEADTPPAEPEDGETWLVGNGASEQWSGHSGCLASFQAGSWVFARPRDGLRMLDKATGQDIRYHSEWIRAEAPSAPTGGSNVDLEARASIVALIEALVSAGVLRAP